MEGMTSRTFFVIYFAFFSLLFVGCPHHVDKTAPPQSLDPNPLIEDPDRIPADIIESAGHGAIFDQLGRPIELSDEKAREIQASMIKVLWRPVEKRYKEQDLEQLRDALALSESDDLRAPDRVLVQSAIIGQLLSRSPENFESRYGWRHRLILSHYFNYYLENVVALPEVIRALNLQEFIDDIAINGRTEQYILKCRSEQVPIPRPWSESSNAWKYQGMLTQKLILPNFDAHVWTYADPQRRGGCIALPRGSGTPGSAAGIICQSATTGKACFWDNILAGTTGPIGWKNKTLNVSNLRNGDSLILNCTKCHRGNNVFLISPDDATWAKVIRPAKQSDVGQNFTTHVERDYVPRYTPVSSQAGWANAAAAQCGGCHERPGVPFPAPAIMPPACKTSGTDPAGCYSP